MALVPRLSLPAEYPLAPCSEERRACQNPLLLKGQNLVGGYAPKGFPSRAEPQEAKNGLKAAAAAAARQPSTKDSLRTQQEAAGLLTQGPTSARELLRPATGTVQGSRPPWGQWGCSQVLRGPCRHGSNAGQCKLLGIVWGGEGGGEGEGGSLAEAGGCLDVPAPRPPSPEPVWPVGYKRGLEQWESYASWRL